MVLSFSYANNYISLVLFVTMHNEPTMILKWSSAVILTVFILLIGLGVINQPFLEEADLRDVIKKSLIAFFLLTGAIVTFRSIVTTKTFLVLFSGFSFSLLSNLIDLSEEILTNKADPFELIEDIFEPLGLMLIAYGLYLWLDERNHLAKLRYDLAKEAGRIGTWEWQIKQDEFMLDDETLEMLGYERSTFQFKQDFIKKLIHKEDGQIFHHELNLHLTGVKPAFELSLKLRKKNGGYGLFMIRGNANFDENKKPEKIYGTITDITQRVEIENQLRESEKNYRLLAENSTDVIATFDKDLNIRYISPSVYKLFGYTPEEISKMQLQKLITPDSYSDVILAYNQLVRNQLQKENYKKETRLNLYFITKSGQQILIEFIATPMWSDDHKHIGYLTTSRKVYTKPFYSKPSENTQNRLFSTAFHLNPIPMCVVRLQDGAFTEANEAFLNALGYSKTELIGKTTEELGNWYSEKEKYEFRKSILSHKQVQEFKMAFTTNKGRVRLAILHAERVRRNNQAQILIIAEDITQNDKGRANHHRFRQLS